MQNTKQQLLDTLFAAEQLLEKAYVDADLLTADVNADVLAELQDKFSTLAETVNYYLD
jgi:hypothetical protein